MANTLYTEIGQRIRRARESAGLSQDDVARRLNYSSPATVSHFENGERKVSLADLQRIGDILGLPLSFFLGDHTEPIDAVPFRLRAAEVQPAARRAVAAFLSFARKHGGNMVSPLMEGQASAQPPATVAGRMLDMLDLRRPPVVPRDIAGRLGVPVFDWRFPDEISGIFVRDGDIVCIGVNEMHPSVRQRFTVAHELGHLLLTGERDLFVDFATAEATAMSDDYREKAMETTANRFASALLMPAPWIVRDVEQSGLDVTTLAKRYGVSEQALWFRLLNLKLVREEDSW